MPTGLPTATTTPAPGLPLPPTGAHLDHPIAPCQPQDKRKGVPGGLSASASEGAHHITHCKNGYLPAELMAAWWWE